MKTIRAAVDKLFADYPELCGFSVQDAGTFSLERASGRLQGNLCLADVSTTPYEPHALLLDEITGALLELIDRHPEAMEELRGRTFARTLH